MSKRNCLPELAEFGNGVFFTLHRSGVINWAFAGNLAMAIKALNLAHVDPELASQVIQAQFGFTPSQSAWKTYLARQQHVATLSLSGPLRASVVETGQ